MSEKTFDPAVGFRSEKAAQIAAFFVKAAGGHMEKLALIKMLYIAERESVRLRHRPMMYDELYSLKDGPICSSALNGINGGIDPLIWAKYIVRHGERDVYLVSENKDNLDQLSESDIKILQEVVAQHGRKTSSQLRNWTHVRENCPEYTEIEDNGRIPIAYGELAQAVGIEDPIEIEESIRQYREAESFITRK